jgi:imidazole glycerol-phosphate synthase subunit HisH
MIKIVDYGSGNIQAIGNIYRRANIAYTVVNTPKDLYGAEKLILPGVGAFDQTMNQLVRSGMKDVLDELVLEKEIPVLGICVGMQILCKGSDEGIVPGLGWIDGFVKKIETKNLTTKPHLPHMGWNDFTQAKESPILNGLDAEKGFYFLHSYYFSCNNTDDILTYSNYGEKFASAVNSKNIYGAQFHPEKSHSNGIIFLENFAKL